jgi:hypothetical protein
MNKNHRVNSGRSIAWLGSTESKGIFKTLEPEIPIKIRRRPVPCCNFFNAEQPHKPDFNGTIEGMTVEMPSHRPLNRIVFAGQE